MTVHQPPSVVPLVVSFTGDSSYLPIVSLGSFTITHRYQCPSVTSINPTIGRDIGGSVVSIYGDGLDQSTGNLAVHFGNHLATALYCDIYSCWVVTPPGTGTVLVTVTQSGCPSAPNRGLCSSRTENWEVGL